MVGPRVALIGLLGWSACHGGTPKVIEDGRAIAAAMCACMDRAAGTSDAQVEACLQAQSSRWNAIETAVRDTESSDGQVLLAAWDRCLVNANAFFDAQEAKAASGSAGAR